MISYTKIIALLIIVNFSINYFGLITQDPQVSLEQIEKIIYGNPKYFSNVIIDEVDHVAYFNIDNTADTYYVKDLVPQNSTRLSVKISKTGDFGEKLSSLYTKKYKKPIDMFYKTEISTFQSVLNTLYYIVIVYICIDVIFNIFFSISFSKDINSSSSSNSSPISNILTSSENSFEVIKDIKTRFSDVIGQKEAKSDLEECINFFKYREKYLKAGYKIPKGVIFAGEPGTGKTLLAKAFAGEAKTTFISVTGSDFMEIFVGMGSQRIRKLFDYARKHSPTIIFIDEIDAIGRKRSKHDSGHNEHGSTLNKLLSEMDGFTNNENIMVIAATNMSETLDPALTRSGRFDKEIIFDPPNKDERKELFELYTKKIQLDPKFTENKDTYLNNLARKTAGLSGADIANICNQSVSMFMKRENQKLTIAEKESQVTKRSIEDMKMVPDPNPKRCQFLRNIFKCRSKKPHIDDLIEKLVELQSIDDLPPNEKTKLLNELQALNNSPETDAIELLNAPKSESEAIELLNAPKSESTDNVLPELNEKELLTSFEMSKITEVKDDSKNSTNPLELKTNKEGVLYEDLEKSIDIVMIGMEKPERAMSSLEKEVVAFHEAGHALISYMLKHSDPPIKVSIIPRGKSALGFTQPEPNDKKLINKDELLSKIHVLLGGRLAEQIKFNVFSTGASDDIDKLTKIAYNMVTRYGMSETIGPINIHFSNDSNLISGVTKNNIEEEVKNIITDAEKNTRDLLKAHSEELDVIAKHLLEKEVLLSEDLDELLEKFEIKNIYL